MAVLVFAAARLSPVAPSSGCSRCGRHRLLTAVASLAPCGTQGLRCPGPAAEVHGHGCSSAPGSGVEPMFPALAGGFHHRATREAPLQKMLTNVSTTRIEYNLVN